MYYKNGILKLSKERYTTFIHLLYIYLSFNHLSECHNHTVKHVCTCALIGASLSELHIDHNKRPNIRNNCGYACMYVCICTCVSLTCVCCTLVSESERPLYALKYFMYSGILMWFMCVTSKCGIAKPFEARSNSLSAMKKKTDR